MSDSELREGVCGEIVLGTVPALQDCSEAYMKMGVVVAVGLRGVHGWQPLVAETERAQSIVFPLDGLVKVHQ